MSRAESVSITSNPSRRQFAALIGVAGAAVAVPVTATVANVSNSDPIYAAIERYRETYEAYDAAVSTECRLEINYPEGQTPNSLGCVGREDFRER